MGCRGARYELTKRIWGGVLLVDRQRCDEALRKADSICGHKKWDYWRDTDEIGWHLGWQLTGSPYFGLARERGPRPRLPGV